MLDATVELRPVIPCQSRGQYLKLFTPCLGIPNTLSQNTRGGVELVHKILPIRQAERGVAALEVNCQKESFILGR